MPDFYNEGAYDLAGFSVGVVEREAIIDGSLIKGGDKVIGLGSSGLHSNGFSLARRVLFEKLGLDVKSSVNGLKKTIGEELLTPTKIYVKTIRTLLRDFRIKGIAHITGGGMIENIPRILPKNTKVVIAKDGWEIPFIFRFIKDGGKIDLSEMFRTFNCGIGMVLIVANEVSSRVMQKLKAMKQTAYLIGEVESKTKEEKTVLIR